MTLRQHHRDEPYPLNRTQALTLRWLHRSGLDGDDLLMEALYRRGFLAYRDAQGVWLGTGSHEADLEVLRLIDGIAVEPVSGDEHRMARVRLIEDEAAPMAVAEAIVSLPENKNRMTSAGLGSGFDRTWEHYRQMRWGTKRPTCPMTENDRGATRVHNALDLGIALFVKALPLARVATIISCDGHGTRAAAVEFAFDWDAAWCSAVFGALHVAIPNTVWFVKDRGLYIVPSCAAEEFAKGFRLEAGFTDAQVLGMLDDIQCVSRRLLDQDTIDRIGHARTRTLRKFRTWPPPDEHSFAAEARCQLEVEFGFAPSGPTHPHGRHQATTDQCSPV